MNQQNLTFMRALSYVLHVAQWSLFYLDIEILICWSLNDADGVLKGQIRGQEWRGSQ